MTLVDFERLAESADDAPAATNTKTPPSRRLFSVHLYSLSLSFSLSLLLSVYGWIEKPRIDKRVKAKIAGF
jgi:hypothetical protein